VDYLVRLAGGGFNGVHTYGTIGKSLSRQTACWYNRPGLFYLGSKGLAIKNFLKKRLNRGAVQSVK